MYLWLVDCNEANRVVASSIEDARAYMDSRFDEYEIVSRETIYKDGTIHRERREYGTNNRPQYRGIGVISKVTVI